MTRIVRHIHKTVIRPTGRTIILSLRLNKLIWTKYFDMAWEATPLWEKLTWLMFLANTLSILTVLHILTIKAF